MNSFGENFQIMKKYGINIKCIIDKRAQRVDDMESITLAQYVSDKGDLVIIASSRFADDINYQIIGTAGKLLNYFIKIIYVCF